jgi:hypothetical protein
MAIELNVLLLCLATHKINCLDWCIATYIFNINVHKTFILGVSFFPPVMYWRLSVIKCILSVWFRDGLYLKDCAVAFLLLIAQM